MKAEEWVKRINSIAFDYGCSPELRSVVLQAFGDIREDALEEAAFRLEERANALRDRAEESSLQDMMRLARRDFESANVLKEEARAIRALKGKGV